MADEHHTTPTPPPKLPPELDQVLKQYGYKAPTQNTVEQLAQRADDQQAITSDLQSQLQKGLKDLSDIRGVVIFGFIVLLIMVAAMIVQSWSERNASYNTLIERVASLQSQVNQWSAGNTLKK